MNLIVKLTTCDKISFEQVLYQARHDGRKATPTQRFQTKKGKVS